MSKIDHFLDYYLILFESCRLTKGYSRTLLYDSQRKDLLFLDNELYTYLSKTSRQQTIGDYLKNYKASEVKIVKEYLEEIVDREYAFVCNKEEIDLFPRIELDWDDPAEISNCIIDFDSVPEDLSDYKNLIQDLDELGCENLQIRCFQPIPVKFILELGKLLLGTTLTRLSLMVKFSHDSTVIQKSIEEIPSVNELIIHGAKEEQSIRNELGQQILYTTQEVNDHSHCGLVSPKLFNLEWEHYLESNSYNSCLNRKVGITTKGEFKNCPSMLTSFGNIKTDRITDVIKQPEFQKIWDYKKDDIEGCKSCEFRHICTDCRAFQEEGDYSKSKPAKCNYNPLKGEWE